jgi:monoamine oxidase
MTPTFLQGPVGEWPFGGYVASMDSEVDIAIVGAGAAGLAAAKALEGNSASTLVLEARSRVGGRAHTVTAGGYSVDMGCGWLHSADVNPFSAIAEGLGFPLDKSPPHWTRQALNIGFSPADQIQYRQALAEQEQRIEDAAAQGRDQPAADLMDPDSPWNPLLDAFSSYYNGAEFDQISTLDYDAYQDSGINWRTDRGYGALIAAFGAGAPLALDTPVTRIDHSGPRLRLETPRGVITAARVIVTLPTPLLAAGDLAFWPDLPDVRAAAAALPLGLADKVFLGLDEPEAFETDSHLFGAPDRTDTGSYHLRPFGRPLIEVYLGGRNAAVLEAQGASAGAAFAIEELVRLLGSDMRRRLTPLTHSAWAADPWARGSYSHAAPGGAWARAVLAMPVEDRIFFAGEATSPHYFSTAHGAAQSGAAAARLALQSLGAPSPA